MITNDARCTREITSRIVMAKTSFNKNKTLFNSRLDLNLRNKLLKCFICYIALIDAKTWTLQKVGAVMPRKFGMWCPRRMEKISWTDHVRNEEVLHRAKEDSNILHTI